MDPRAFGYGAVVEEPIGLPAATQVKRAIKIEVDKEIRCNGKVPLRSRPGEAKICGKLLVEQAGRPWRVKCPRCGTINQSPAPGAPPVAMKSTA